MRAYNKMIHIRQLFKLNKSLGMTIPKSLTRALGWSWKDVLAIKQVDERTIIIRKFVPLDEEFKNAPKTFH